MKKLITSFTSLSLLIATSFAQVTTADSLALVDLYNNTNGASWTNSTNWLSANPVSTWYGIEEAAGRVSEIDLRGNNLNGTINSSITTLTGCYNLLLQDNVLTGAIPSAIGSMSVLQRIVLSNNSLTGSIPASVTSLTNCYELNLVNCGLTGGIPSDIGSMTAMQYLWLNGNTLGGSIPASLMNLSNLRAVALNGNGLTGSIPSGFAGIPLCQEIYLNDNSLSGSIPIDIGDATSINQLWLDNNNLDGTIPGSILDLSSLQYLGLSNNNITGTIHDFTGSISTIEWLFFGGNDFNKITMSASTSLTYLDVSDNNLKFFQLENILDDPATLTYIPQDTIGNKVDTNLAQGSDYTFTTSDVTAGNSYTWYKDGGEIAGETNSYYTINSIANGDAGVYHCEITNSNWAGLTIIQNTTTVNVSCTPPEVTLDPSNNTITEGFNISFEIEENFGVSYQWQENQGSGFSNLSDDATYSGSSTTMLTITAAPISFDGYQYRCIVTGSCAPTATSASATLTVATAISTFTKYVKDATYGKQNLNVQTPPTTANNVYILPAPRTGATYYTVQISTASDFSANLEEKSGTAAANWYFTNLTASSTYYTRASVNGGAYSNPKTFVIEGTATPVGTSKLGKTYDVVFGWQNGSSNPTTSANVYCRPTPVSGATLYTVEVNSDPNYGAGTAITRSAADWSKIGPYYFSGLSANTTYYVRVMVDIEGFWGDTRTFVTDCCSRPSARKASSTSIEEVDEMESTIATKYNIYPNPFVGQLNMRVDSDNDEQLSIRVVDLSGKEVLSSNNYYTNSDITLGEELEKGLYMVQIVHGENVKVLRVVKN